MKRFGFDEEDDEEALSDLFSFDDIEEEPSFISDTANSVKLVSKLICCADAANSGYSSIIKGIDDIFELLSTVTFDDELACYNNMQALCGRLMQQKKIQKLNKKTVIGLGGQFSAGKSKFINSVAGICGLLPEAQSPTTSIPTFIIYSPEEKFIANLINGNAVELSREEAGAITHEFYDSYNIGFASFIESIIIETPDFTVDNSLSFLDTPGYSKYDSKAESDNVLSDKQKALDQLRLADRLIWLVNIENGTLTKDDLEFLSMLNNEEKILIVLNKADKVTESDIEEVRKLCIETAKEHGLNIFGVAAYSSSSAIEFNGSLIEDFLKDAAAGMVRKNDIYSSFLGVESIIGENLESKINKLRSDCYNLRDKIYILENIINIRSFTHAIYTKTIEVEHMSNVWTSYMSKVNALNKKIGNYIKE